MESLENKANHNKPKPTEFKPTFPKWVNKGAKFTNKYKRIIIGYSLFYALINVFSYEGLKLLQKVEPNYEISYKSINKNLKDFEGHQDAPRIVEDCTKGVLKLGLVLIAPSVKYYEWKQNKNGIIR